MEDAEDDGHQEDWNIGARDCVKIESDLEKAGIRAGITAGHEANIQTGFNAGYKTAAEIVYKIANLRGEISATICCRQLNNMEDKLMDAELEKLMLDVKQIEEKYFKSDILLNLESTKLQNMGDNLTPTSQCKGENSCVTSSQNMENISADTSQSKGDNSDSTEISDYKQNISELDKSVEGRDTESSIQSSENLFEADCKILPELNKHLTSILQSLRLRLCEITSISQT